MSKEIKIGATAIGIIALAFWGFNFMKGNSIFDSDSRTFFIEYKNIQGLQKSSPVSINGLSIGKVSDIYFNTKKNKKGGLIVKITLKNDLSFSKKSVAKIYSSSLLGGKSLAIIPNYEGEVAVSNDTLIGQVESDIFSSVEAKLNPLQSKLESVIVSADTIFKSVNDLIDKNTRESLKRSVLNFEYTVADIRKTVNRVDKYIDSNSVDLKTTILNAEKMIANLTKFSDTLSKVKVNELVFRVNKALTSMNELLDGINNGEGTVGKLMKNDSLYNNLNNASKELEELMRDLKLNPKRFVHFSLFGKKAKPYNSENNQKKKSN